MTIEDFIKPEKTYVVITINNDIWVDCYKTSKIKFIDEDKALEIYEDDIHSEYLSLYDVEINNFYIKWSDWNDGHTHEVLIYDTTSSESLMAAYEELQKFSDKFNDMRLRVESFKNFVYYERMDKIKSEKKIKEI